MNPPSNFDQMAYDLSGFCERTGYTYRHAIALANSNALPGAFTVGRRWYISHAAVDRMLEGIPQLPADFTGEWERIVLTDIGEELDVLKTCLPTVLLTETTSPIYVRKRLCPVLMAEVCGDGVQCRGWCDFCSRWHYHGNGDGHRVAHCTTVNSPYRKTGYILFRVPKVPEQPRRWPVTKNRFGEKLASCPVELLDPVE